MYPIFPLIAPAQNDTIIIANPSYAGDYAQINGLIDEKAYMFTSDSIDDIITIRTLDNSSVLAYGVQPLTFISQNDTSITVHFNTENCGEENIPRVTKCIGVFSPLDTVYKVGIGVEDPAATLDINGKMKLSDDASFVEEGMMRYDKVRKEFQGYDGTRWVSLMADKPNWGTQPLSAREYDEILTATPYNLNQNANFGRDIATYKDFSIITSKFYAFIGQLIIYNYNESTKKVELHQVLNRQDGFSTDHKLANGGIDMTDSLCIVGCYKTGNDEEISSGHAFIMTLEDGLWTVQDSISNPSEDPNHRFGVNVAIHNNLAMVETELGEDSLLIEVFENSGGNWNHIHTIPQNFSSNGIKNKLVVHDNHLIIGYPGGGINLRGKVIIHKYDAESNTIDSVSTLENYTFFNNDKFGFDIKMDQNILAISAPLDTIINYGRVFLFQVEADTIIYLQQIVEEKSQDYNQFGYAIDLKNDHLIITSINTSQNPNGNTYVYQNINNEWELVSKLGLITDSLYDPYSYGFSVGYTPKYILVGLPKQVPFTTGKVAVYYKN
jgi:hypothetical protein